MDEQDEIKKMLSAPAKKVEWYSINDTAPLECKICGWHGILKDCPEELHNDLADYRCPSCEKMLVIRSFPTLTDEMAHWQ